VDSIAVRWPSGKIDSIGVEAVDQELVVREGAGVIKRRPSRH